jgi:GWxTD domain-containing protein
VVHQIHLAEQFIREGKQQFKSFIEEKWKSGAPDIQLQAALALARLGEQQALQYLEGIDGDELQQEKISSLIARIKKSQSTIPVDSGKGKIRIAYPAEKLKTQPEKIEAEGILPGLKTRRYEQYQSMLHMDDNWTREELNDFALWYIIDTDEFEEYRNLPLDYDRQEWLRKFWKRKDPTPTTERNEMKEEFDRRILFSRSYFAQFWNNRSTRYLPDQHLRYGWEHAPWDARGELYIKYGEPEVRSVEGWHTEEWIYYRYNVDFIVKQYMTNIYGNAIAAGTMTQQMQPNFQNYNPYNYTSPLYQMFDEDNTIHRNWNTYLDQNYIYNPEIRYEHDYASKILKGFQMTSRIRPGDDSLEILLNYSIPQKEFNLDDQEMEIPLSRTYRECIIILDEDLCTIKKEQVDRTLPSGNGEDTSVYQEVSIRIGKEQPELQTYTFYISIYDSLNNKQGIYTQELEPVY